jgi:hypothetical protein
MSENNMERLNSRLKQAGLHTTKKEKKRGLTAEPGLLDQKETTLALGQAAGPTEETQDKTQKKGQTQDAEL